MNLGILFHCQRGYKASKYDVLLLLCNISTCVCCCAGEGGYREPGIAWWPGKIKAGSFSPSALVATYDIFPTVLSIAGVPPPKGVVLDGMDLSPLLFSQTPGQEPAHACIMMYKRPESQLGPAGAAALDSLSAVRCGDHKVYWFIDGTSTTPLPAGVKLGAQSLEAPVIFDLASDVSEDHPLPGPSAPTHRAKPAASHAPLLNDV